MRSERRELHRAPVDERLEHVVLDLLVDDEEDRRRRSRPVVEWRNATTQTMIAAIVAPASGIRSRMRDEQPERDGERDAEQREHDASTDAGDRG